MWVDIYENSSLAGFVRRSDGICTMKYFLLWRKSDNHMMIDTRVRKGWKTQERTEADSWLEAKQNFGFELSPLQKEILDAKDDRTKIGRRIV